MAITRTSMILSLAMLVATVLPAGSGAWADKRPKRLLLLSARSADSSPSRNDGYPASVDLAGGVGSLLETDPKRSQLFDDYYMDGVKKLQFEAAPDDNPNEFDERKSSRAAQRALTVKVGQTVSDTLNRSDLRDVYRDALQGFKEFRDSVRVSVQKGDEGYTVSRAPKGSKLLELDVEPSDKTLLAPHVNVGETGRVRYDTSNDAVMFELRREW